MTENDSPTGEHTVVWHGVLDPSLLLSGSVQAGHRLADAAKTGDWTSVLRLLDDPAQLVDVNWWRPGGIAWFTPLHHAAWHGAPPEVAAALIRRGALRSLKESRGRTAYDIWVERDRVGSGSKSVVTQARRSAELRTLLQPPPSPAPPRQVQALDAHLADVIDGRIRGVLHDGRDPRRVLRYPPVEILHEIPSHRVWFPVPGMYGGFDITLRQDILDVTSLCRVVSGSGQAHLITEAGAILVDEGFV